MVENIVLLFSESMRFSVGYYVTEFIVSPYTGGVQCRVSSLRFNKMIYTSDYQVREELANVRPPTTEVDTPVSTNSRIVTRSSALFLVLSLHTL